MRQLFNHPEIVSELGERAKKWVASEYDWDKITAQTEALYQRLRKKKE